MKNTKDYSISFIRMCAMIGVICCHIFQQSSPGFGSMEAVMKRTGDYAANGVQVFLLISGFLYGTRENLFTDAISRVQFIIKNFKKILLDYWIYCIAVILPIYRILAPEAVSLRTVLEVLTTSSVIGGVHHVWFIPYILFCYLITPYLYDFKEYLRRKEAIFTGLVVLIFWTEWVFYFFRVYYISDWICCYIRGFFLSEFTENVKRKKSIWWILLIICVFLNIFRYYVSYMDSECFPDWLSLKLCNWSQNVFAIVFFFVLKGRSVKSYRIKRLLDISDRYSYDIYLAHMIYVKGIISTIFLTSSMAVNLCITIFLIVFSGMILYYICRPKDAVRLAHSRKMKRSIG